MSIIGIININADIFIWLYYQFYLILCDIFKKKNSIFYIVWIYDYHTLKCLKRPKIDITKGKSLMKHHLWKAIPKTFEYGYAADNTSIVMSVIYFIIGLLCRRVVLCLIWHYSSTIKPNLAFNRNRIRDCVINIPIYIIVNK